MAPMPTGEETAGFIREHWPMVRERIPGELWYVALGQGPRRIDVFHTHQDVFLPEWVTTGEGGPAFASATDVPDGFAAAGIYSTDFERLFVMWARGGRRFHFRLTYYAAELGLDQDLYALTRKRLVAALEKWDATRDAWVIHGGDDGWYLTEQKRWEASIHMERLMRAAGIEPPTK